MSIAEMESTLRPGSAIRFNEIVIDSSDPLSLAPFWAEALGYEIDELEEDVASIEHPTDDGPAICFQRVPESKQGKNRVHFDLNVDDDELESAVQRLISLGAKQVDVGQGVDRSWVVLADPEGNEFCIVG
jgi:predicted enzyme related to lactoylglutathione lyase